MVCTADQFPEKQNIFGVEIIFRQALDDPGGFGRDCRVFPLVVRVAVLALERVARSAVPERVRAVVRLGCFRGLCTVQTVPARGFDSFPFN